jgi:hypothetical protein
MQATTPATKQYRCRHIFTDGRRCASPCLRHEEFCYYHHTTRRPVANPRQRRGRRSTFDLPNPEDRSAIQSSIGEVLRRIASNDIDPRRAGLLLYGLQIASLNLPRATTRSRYTGRSRDIEESPETMLIEEIVIDPELGTVAPRAEFTEAEERLSAVALLLKEIEREDYQDRQDREEQERRRDEAKAAEVKPDRKPDRLDAPRPALEDAEEAPQSPNPAGAILPTIQAAEAAKQPTEAPKSLASRQRTRLRRRAKPPASKKSAKKLTRTPGIAIVRGFREYPGRAVRETRHAEGWRKAQAN